MKTNCNCIYHLANVAAQAQKKSQVEICETAEEMTKEQKNERKQNEKRKEMKKRRKVHKKKGEIVVHLCKGFLLLLLEFFIRLDST